jgi:hypothetical protein
MFRLILNCHEIIVYFGFEHQMHTFFLNLIMIMIMLLECLYSRQHGYGYVYRYPADTDTSIHHFLKQSDTWICLNIFSKNNIVHMRYKIKENKQQYSMRTHFKGFKHDP